MITIPTNRLNDGDMVLHRGKVYRVKMQTCRHCAAECSMYDVFAGKCLGFCYRWPMPVPLVFIYLKDELQCKDTDIAYVSDMPWDAILNLAESRAANLSKIHRKKGGTP